MPSVNFNFTHEDIEKMLLNEAFRRLGISEAHEYDATLNVQRNDEPDSHDYVTCHVAVRY